MEGGSGTAVGAQGVGHLARASLKSQSAPG